MIRIISLIVIFILFISGLIAQPIYLSRNIKVGFVSDAPLEIIKAESTEVQGAIDLSDRTFVFTIDNRSFIGFNSDLQQEHFYENYMEIQEFPVSAFKGRIIEEINLNTSAEQVVRARGILDIHGVEQERILKGVIRASERKLQIDAEFTVLLEDHNIKIPRVVYQKIAEMINVSVSAELILQ